MNGAVPRAVLFGLALTAVFAVAVGIGRLVGPLDVDDEPAGHDDHDTEAAAAGVAGDEWQLALPTAPVEAGSATPLSLTISRDGEPVTDYAVVHEKRLHLIAVRDDFRAYQHVHPELGGDGTWTVEADLSPGTWQVYADFQPEGGSAMVLDGQIEVAGHSPGPEPAATAVDTREATVGPYTVRLAGDASVADSTVLTPKVTLRGRDVTGQLEPYLGARGHLVAIRRSDLAYLHVHPEGLDFHTEFDRAGTYELYLDFKHRGVVRTAHFTLVVDPEPTAAPTALEEDGHDH